MTAPITTEDLRKLVSEVSGRSYRDTVVEGDFVATIAAELITARAKLEAAEKLADALHDFATAKIDALRFPGVIRSPEDEPDPVVEADYVWALQDDAKTALAAWEAAQ